MCLFDVLCKEAKERNWYIYPVHVNHKFRPGAAEADQAYVENLCQRRGWPCTSFVYDCNKIATEEKMTSEEAGRKARYDAFGKRARALVDAGIAKESIVIAVAQNGDDQAETIYEIADLAYHVLVLMVQMGISVEDIRTELASRHVIDHKVKQEKMT